VSGGVSTDQQVRVDDEGPVRVLTLDDPARRNALSLQMREELNTALYEAMEDPACRAVVLTGAGGYFCAGGDPSSMPVDDPAAGYARLGVLAEVVTSLVQGPKPVVAAVAGPAFGSGLSLAAACDYVVAEPAARFCASFGRVGLIADGGLMWTLPRRVGPARARALLLRGTVLDSETAYGYGLVDERSAPEQQLALAVERATELAAGPPLATAATKALTAGQPVDLAGLLAAEAGTQVHLFGSADFQEGRDALRDRRPPRFQGR
jgi:2-(1,2-epoxy-1,2-dihydrophenyl)acetyl-CoA isomerase